MQNCSIQKFSIIFDETNTWPVIRKRKLKINDLKFIIDDWSYRSGR